MDVGMTLPGRGPLAEPESLEQLSRRADELGFAYLAVPDHIVVPDFFEFPQIWPYRLAEGRLVPGAWR